MDPITAAALITGGSSLVSNIFGSHSAASAEEYAADKNYEAQVLTNQSNERNVDATNAMNRLIAQENNRFNRESLNIQNLFNSKEAELAFARQRMAAAEDKRYNSMPQQVLRYLQAGLNPGALAGSVGAAANVGSSSAASSSAAAPADESGTQIPFQAVAPKYDYTQSAFTRFVQNLGPLTQSIGQMIDNTYKSTVIKHDLQEQQKRMTKMDIDAGIAEMQKKLMDMTFDSQVENAELQNYYLKASTSMVQEQTRNFESERKARNIATMLGVSQDTREWARLTHDIQKDVNMYYLEIDKMRQDYRIAMTNAANDRYAIDSTNERFQKELDATNERFSKEYRLNSYIAKHNVRQGWHKLQQEQERIKMAQEMLPWEKAKNAGIAVGAVLGGAGQAAKTYYDAKHPNKGKLRYTTTREQPRMASNGDVYMSHDVGYVYW